MQQHYYARDLVSSRSANCDQLTKSSEECLFDKRYIKESVRELEAYVKTLKALLCNTQTRSTANCPQASKRTSLELLVNSSVDAVSVSEQLANCSRTVHEPCDSSVRAKL